MKLGIGLSLGKFSKGLDSNAQAFISAAGITNPTQQNAINQLVINLKTYGLWTKMKAVYPFVTDQRNLISYSEDFGNAYWTKNDTTITSNATTAPNGTNTASYLTENATNNVHRLYQYNNTIGTLTTSVYVKYNGRQYFGIRLYNTSGTMYALQLFDVLNGTIGTQLVSGLQASSTITNVGNGWYRLTMTLSAQITNGNLLYFLSNSNTITDTGGTTYTGNGTSGVYIWGAQLELGSTATTYQPIIGSQQGYVASQMKYNLVNPQDTDAAFRLVFNGGWTFDNNGATPNGTNAYADTKFIPSSNLVATSQSSSIYSRTNSNNGSNANVDFSAAATGVGNFTIIAGLNLIGINGFTRYGQTRDVRITTAQRLDGYFVGSRISSVSLSLYRSNVLLGFDGGAEIGISNIAPYIGAENNNGLATYFTNRQYCFSHIGDGLTDTDASNLYTAVQTFQTTLNRYVGVPIVSDANAQAFLNAAQITDITQANAVNTLVQGLKADGLWTKMKAVYPMVGGTASSCKYNLVNPQDTDAAFRLVFNGGWRFDNNGATPNGTNAYADTKLIPNNVLSQNNKHLSSYVITLSNNTLIGSGISSSSTVDQIVDVGGTLYSNLSSTFSSGSVASQKGLYIVRRVNSSTANTFINNTLSFTDNQISTGQSTNYIFISARNVGTIDFYSNSQCAFATIGDGLTDTDALNLYNRVQTFQTSLSRQV